MLSFEYKLNLGSRVQLDVQWSTSRPALVIMGPSGCGKTTTLRVLAGLQNPDTGNIRVENVTFFDSATGVNLPPQKRSIGYVFQSSSLFPHMDVRGNVVYGADERQPDFESRFQALVRILEIDELLDEKPQKLSGGQKQRVAIARALMPGPELLLLDEPFSSLDYVLKRRLRGYLSGIIGSLVPNTVIVTHDHADAQLLDAEVVEMMDGTIRSLIQSGEVKTVAHIPDPRGISF